MAITVLSELLGDPKVRRRVAAELGRDRATVYRWWRGQSFPLRADAEQLVALLADEGLDFNGCYGTGGQVDG